MYFALMDLYDSISGFMDRGGNVLWVIAFLLVLKFSLVFERLWYLYSTHAKQAKHTLAAWNQRTDKKSWKARQIRGMMLSQLSINLRSGMSMIEALVVICPLLGLLGTVTGMIEVFFVMALTGGGDAKSMAGGVSKATIPTMAGMVGALAGIFAFNFLKTRVDRDLELLADHMALVD